MRCVMDVYFDNVKQPLHWDDKVRVTDMDVMATSAKFLPKQIARPLFQGVKRTPLSEPTGTGNDLWWHVKFSGLTGGGGAIIAAYDRSIFDGLSFFKLGQPCGENVQMQLQTYAKEKDAIYHTVLFPASWRQRTKDVIQAVNAKNEAHFKTVFEDMKKPSNSSN